MEQSVKNRVMLSLRGEKAFGLPNIKSPRTRPVISAVASNPASPMGPAPVRPLPAPVQAEAGRKIEPTQLYMDATAPFEAPVIGTQEKRKLLAELDEKSVRICTKCPLCKTRTQTVFGEGDPDAKIFFIGEGPGENEDLQGRPFVGRAGQLLDKMINAMGLSREQVYIANIVKCRPPENRVPAPLEVHTCTPYLIKQIETIRPRVIVTLGRPAVQFMLNTNATMGSLRGRWQEWRGIKLMPTYHPSYVLRSYTAETRAAVWSDLKMVLEVLELPVPKRGAS